MIPIVMVFRHCSYLSPELLLSDRLHHYLAGASLRQLLLTSSIKLGDITNEHGVGISLRMTVGWLRWELRIFQDGESSFRFSLHYFQLN